MFNSKAIFMKKIICIFGSLLLASASIADIEATTSDGKKVRLNKNGTWQYILEGEKEATPAMAKLILEKRQELPNGCRLGLRMHNDTNDQVRSLVLRFTALKPGNISFETVSRGYSYIKPTASQYQEIRFRGLSCDEIDKVQVHAAHNCHVGELTKYSASEERCLELVDVKESSKLTIYKAPPVLEEQAEK